LWRGPGLALSRVLQRCCKDGAVDVMRRHAQQPCRARLGSVSRSASSAESLEPGRVRRQVELVAALVGALGAWVQCWRMAVAVGVGAGKRQMGVGPVHAMGCVDCGAEARSDMALIGTVGDDEQSVNGQGVQSAIDSAAQFLPADELCPPPAVCRACRLQSGRDERILLHG